MATGQLSSIRGHRKLECIRDLAMRVTEDGIDGRAELAEKYGVAGPTLYKFAQDFAAEIQAYKLALTAEVMDECAALWIASKANRIAEYQQSVDDINHLLSAYGESAIDCRLLRAKHDALKAVAEELGDLPVRMQAAQSGSTIVYQIEGIASDELRAGLT